MDQAIVRHRVRRVLRGAESGEVEDALAVEEPLEIRINGRSIAVTMRTPGNDRELVAGFLLGEGVVKGASDIAQIRPCDRGRGERVDVLLADGVRVDLGNLTRHVFASSSCGVCGASTLDAVRRQFPGVEGDRTQVTHAGLWRMGEALNAAQPVFAATGGLHAAAVFGAEGNPVVIREDVGRHNAVDKALGHLMMAGCLPLRGHALVVSGRLSFEIVQKALSAGVPIVAAVSAPSSLAVDLADEAGMTLVGFLREGRFNIYTHAERIRP